MVREYYWPVNFWTEGNVEIDLNLKELDYLIGLVNQDFCQKQSKGPGNIQTPFENGVFKKLMDTDRKVRG